MGFAIGLKCRECHRKYALEPVNACDFCFGPLAVDYDYKLMAKTVNRKRISEGPHTIWRYHDMLPVGPENAVDIGAGFTPLIKANNLGRMLGLDNLYIKNDSVNPSYSFKDRVVSVAATKALEFGFETLSCASTGNLACAVGAHAARAGMKYVVFIPADLEAGKIVGAAIYGGDIFAIDGGYDQVNRLCSEIAEIYPWAFVNINMRPYYAEGSKTLGFEVAEQLGWSFPDHVVVPVASGALLTKINAGFREMNSLGLVEGSVKTKFYGVQAEGCSPIVDAYLRGETKVRPVRPNSVAKSLAIGNPADGVYALQTMKESEGAACKVTEEEVHLGIELLAQTEGIFTETAGGVVISALKNLADQGTFGYDETVVVYVTGNGLKTQEAVSHVVSLHHIRPTINDFESALKGSVIGAR